MRRFSMLATIRTLAIVLVLVMVGAGWDRCGNQGNSNGSASTSAPLSTKRIDDLAKTSRELAHDVGLGIDTVAILYKNGKLSIEKKDALAAQLLRVSTAGRSFNSFVVRLDAQEKAGTLPANWIQLITQEWATFFDLYRGLTTELAQLQLSPAEQKQIQAGTKKLDKAVSELQSTLGNK